MVAMAYLAAIIAEEKVPLLSVIVPTTQPGAFPLLPLTIPETRHLLARRVMAHAPQYETCPGLVEVA
jgi:hypothetical protein